MSAHMPPSAIAMMTVDEYENLTWPITVDDLPEDPRPLVVYILNKHHQDRVKHQRILAEHQRTLAQHQKQLKALEGRTERALVRLDNTMAQLLSEMAALDKSVQTLLHKTGAIEDLVDKTNSVCRKILPVDTENAAEDGTK